MFHGKCLGLYMWVTQKINEWTLFPFFHFVIFFITFVNIFNIITDTMIHSYYDILGNSQLIFCHFVFSSKSKTDYG